MEYVADYHFNVRKLREQNIMQLIQMFSVTKLTPACVRHHGLHFSE